MPARPAGVSASSIRLTLRAWPGRAKGLPICPATIVTDSPVVAEEEPAFSALLRRLAEYDST